jgi:hypothetical protein
VLQGHLPSRQLRWAHPGVRGERVGNTIHNWQPAGDFAGFNRNPLKRAKCGGPSVAESQNSVPDSMSRN